MAAAIRFFHVYRNYDPKSPNVLFLPGITEPVKYDWVRLLTRRQIRFYHLEETRNAYLMDSRGETTVISSHRRHERAVGLVSALCFYLSS